MVHVMDVTESNNLTEQVMEDVPHWFRVFHTIRESPHNYTREIETKQTPVEREI